VSFVKTATPFINSEGCPRSTGAITMQRKALKQVSFLCNVYFIC